MVCFVESWFLYRGCLSDLWYREIVPHEMRVWWIHGFVSFNTHYPVVPEV